MYLNCFLPPVAADGMDENGLRFEKKANFFKLMIHLISSP